MNVSLDPHALFQLGAAASDLAARLERVASAVEEAQALHHARTEGDYRVRCDAPALARHAASRLAALDAWAGRVGRAVKLADEGAASAGLRAVHLDAMDLGDLVFGPAGRPSAAQASAFAGALDALMTRWVTTGRGTVADPDDAVAALGRLEQLDRLLAELTWFAATPAAATELLDQLGPDRVERLLLVAEDAGRLVEISANLDVVWRAGSTPHERGSRLRDGLLAPVVTLLSQAARQSRGRGPAAAVVRRLTVHDAGRLLSTSARPSDELLELVGGSMLRRPRPDIVPSTANPIDVGWLSGERRDPLLPLLEALAARPDVAARVLQDPATVPTLLQAPSQDPMTAEVVAAIVATTDATWTPGAPMTAEHATVDNLLVHAGSDDHRLHPSLRGAFSQLLARNLDVLGPHLAPSRARWADDWTLDRMRRLAGAVSDVAGEVQFDPVAATTLLHGVLTEVALQTGVAVDAVAAGTDDAERLNLDAATAELGVVTALAGVVLGGVVAASNDKAERRRQVDTLAFHLSGLVTSALPLGGLARHGRGPGRAVLMAGISGVLVDRDEVLNADVPEPRQAGAHLAGLVDAAVRARVAQRWGTDAIALADDVATAFLEATEAELVAAVVLTD